MEVGDRHWHALVLAGDERAWRDGYDAAFDSVERYVHWRCGGAADVATDVVQETWMTAVRRIGSYRPESGPFAAWVRGVAANILRNAVRERQRRRARYASLVGDCPAPAPENDVAERSIGVAQALARLPDHYEHALRAKYCDGLSVAAIAAETDQSLKSVESLLSRASEAFRTAYEAGRAADG